MPRIESLDGIRAIAVSIVVLFHLGLMPVGWIGVQIFFVLSGFLITGILLDAKGAGLRSFLASFYWRRSLRIFPLYFVFLLIAAAVFSSFQRDWPWLLTYTANFARLRDSDLAEPFVHLWSLAVEEQFYLAWPFVVFFLSAARLRRLIIALLIVAPLWRLAVYLVPHGSADLNWIGRTIYSLPLSHADAFAAGAALVVFKIRNPGAGFFLMVCATAAAGAAVIAHQHLAYHSAMKWSFGYAMFLLQGGGFVWGYSLLNITAAMGIAAAMAHRPQVLEMAPLRRVGTVSYGIYVYHLPLLVIMEQYIGSAHGWMIAPYLAVIFVVAEVSYRYLELPFLRLKDRKITVPI